MRSGALNPMFGRKHTLETKAKLAGILRVANETREYDISRVSVRIPDGVDLGYLAGLVDGEGSIRARRGRPFVAVYNTDAGIIRWLIGNVGGHAAAHDKRGRRPCWAWRVSGARDVFALCRALCPLLIAKKFDAACAVATLTAKYGEAKLHG